ncbi:MAG: hypothetical protein AAB626_00230 [Patescibacteria group bacterium]
MSEENQTTQNKENAPQPEEKEEYKPKLTKTEIFFIGGLYALSDVFVFLITPLGLSSLISVPRTGASQIYFYFKKMRGEITAINLITGAVTSIPVLGGAIPSVIGWAIIAFVDQIGMAKLEKIAGKMGKAGEFIEKTAKKASKVTGKI